MLSVLLSLVYQATLAAFGLIGNAYILGNQIKGGLQEVKHDMKQIEMKFHDTAVAEKLVKDCGKNK